jgi:hypothetical protein
MTDDDDALLRRLGAALAPLDAPPPDVLAAAKASFLLRDLDGELADLVFDSALEAEPVGVRGGSSRLLSFETGDGGVELQVVDDERVLGQVVPPARTHVEVVGTVDSHAVDTDELGRFAVPRPAGGPVRLRWRSGDRLTRTDWVVL